MQAQKSILILSKTDKSDSAPMTGFLSAGFIREGKKTGRYQGHTRRSSNPSVSY